LKATTTDKIDLNGYKTRKEVLEKLIRQINKDLEINVTIEWEEQGIDLYQSIIDKVAPVIEKLIRQGNGRVEQLLYKIDVSEKKVKETFNSTLETDPTVIFTQLIIERELQKVVFRMVYSKTLTE
jgi:molybdopterin-guanine dinucleotide biosynthesis protein A